MVRGFELSYSIIMISKRRLEKLTISAGVWRVYNSTIYFCSNATNAVEIVRWMIDVSPGVDAT